MQALQDLEDKLGALLKQFTALKAENRRLRKAIADKDRILEAQERQLAELKQHLLAAEVAAVLPGPKEKQKTRKQLDAVIGEIDKILTSLND